MDANRVAFISYEPNFVAGDTNGRQDIFVNDLTTGAISSVTLDMSSVPMGDPQISSFAFSGDGSRMAISTGLSNVVPGDTNGKYDVFLASFGSARTAEYVENAAAIQIAPRVNVGDSDSATYANGSLTIAITGGAVAGDTLSLSGTGIAVAGGVVSYNGTAVGTLTASATSLSIALNGSADDAAVQAIAQAARYSSSSDNPTNANRSITFTLVDGGGTAGVGPIRPASFKQSR